MKKRKCIFDYIYVRHGAIQFSDHVFKVKVYLLNRKVMNDNVNFFFLTI